MQTRLNNISTNNSTTKFESKFGMINIAPIKVSGNYKIVIDENNLFYLDNYNGYRIGLDTTRNFLPQVASFLNEIGRNSNIQRNKLGGYRNGTKISWHIPTYLGNDKKELPKYFVLNKVLNSEIKNKSDISNSDNDLLKVIDLDKIGLTKIFNQLIDNQTYSQYLFYFNWEDELIKLNGYDIVKQVNTTANFSTVPNQANQTKLENLNNSILNQYGKNNLIYPLFINIEFEFSTLPNYDTKFNNYHGYFSNGKIVDLTTFDNSKISASISKYTNKNLEFVQERFLENIKQINYSDIIANEIVEVPTNTIPQINLKVTHIGSGDNIIINQTETEIFYKYVVKTSDIKKTLDETMRSISKNILVETSRSVVCDYNKESNIFRIKLESADLLSDDYFISGSPNLKLHDKSKYFNQIRNTDLRIISSGNIAQIIEQNIISNIGVSDKKHNLVKFFYFDNFLIVRLNDINGDEFQNDVYFSNNENNKKIISIYVEKSAILTEFSPTRYFGVNTELEAKVQFEKTEYIKNLKTKFGNSTDQTINEAFTKSIELYENQNNFEDILPYVKRYTNESNGISEIIQSNVVSTNEDNNDKNILNMLFGDGNTSYITPNVCNFDSRFFVDNGNINYEMGTKDAIRFHWFLIKAETPKYISDNVDDIRNLRYFTDKPKLTTRLIRSNKTLDFCETTFLGVKYKIPAKYEGYQFATYLDFNDTSLISIEYNMEVDNVNKILYLQIGKYLDFVDLLRGGNNTNQPLIDLSFFYCVKDAHNTQSELSLSFKTGGLLMCDEETSVMFNNDITKDWKYFDENSNKWYVCLKRSLVVQTSELTELIKRTTESVEFYVYSTIDYMGQTYNFVSLKYTLFNVVEVQNDYVWCEDVTVEFFDTKKFFTTSVVPYFQGIEPDEYNKIEFIDKAQIISSQPFTQGIYFENQVMKSTILVSSENRVFKLLNYDKTFSLKGDYFEFTRKNKYDGNGNKTVEETFFYFPEFIHNGWNFLELFNQFDYGSMDSVTPLSKITLFDRNQLWYFLKDIARYDLKFKAQTERQVVNTINELLVSRLQEFSTLNPLPIINATGIQDRFINIGIFVNDTNPVIWEDVNGIKKITKATRYSGNYTPLLFEINDEIELQNQNSKLKNKYGETIHSLYNENFTDLKVNATGFWNDIQGNIVSTLWSSKAKTLSFTIPFERYGTIQNIIDGLKIVVPIEEALINNNRNIKYIEKINKNVDSWIHENYIIWLLDSVWKLDNVSNELNQKLMFEFTDTPSNYVVKLNELSQYSTIFNTATFNFVRK